MSPSKRILSRRAFVRDASVLSAAALLPTNLRAQAKEPERPPTTIPNRDTQLKFNSEGEILPFAGNTVICHLPAQCAMRDAMVAFHHELAKAPFHHKLGLTSTDSYHMTIFPGANDKGRDVYGWPSYVPFDAPIEKCNSMVGQRMAEGRLVGKLPFRVRVDEASTMTYPTAATLRMVPQDDAENRNLRAVRDQLSEIYGFRLKDHDSYAFHITMSYQIAAFTAKEETAYRDLLGVHTQRIVKAAPTLELGMPEFCTFPDMFRFDPQTLISVCEKVPTKA